MTHEEVKHIVTYKLIPEANSHFKYNRVIFKLTDSTVFSSIDRSNNQSDSVQELIMYVLTDLSKVNETGECIENNFKTLSISKMKPTNPNWVFNDNAISDRGYQNPIQLKVVLNLSDLEAGSPVAAESSEQGSSEDNQYPFDDSDF